MIKSLLSYTKENVGEFVKYNIFSKNKTTKIYVICYLIFMIVIASVGVITAIVTQMLYFCYGYFGFAYCRCGRHINVCCK